MVEDAPNAGIAGRRITRSSAGSVGAVRVGPRVHPARFLGSELLNDFDPGGKAGCGTRAYGNARVG